MAHAGRSPSGERSQHAGPGPRGFTMVEMIVVVVLLAIFAGLIAPRVLNTTERQAEAESRQAQRLLTILAEREAVSAEPQAIEYDQRDGQLRLLVRRTVTGAAADAQPDWRVDPGVPPLTFVRSHLADAFADGRSLPRGRWRLVVSGSGGGGGGDQPRPGISLVIRAGQPTSGAIAPADEPAWVVALGSDAPAASWGSVKTQPPAAIAAMPRAVDLDASGKGDKPW